MRGESRSRHNEERRCCRRRPALCCGYLHVFICKGGDDRGIMARSPKKVSCNQMTLFLLVTVFGKRSDYSPPYVVFKCIHSMPDVPAFSCLARSSLVRRSARAD